MQPTYSSSRILLPVRPWFIVLTLFVALLLNLLPCAGCAVVARFRRAGAGLLVHPPAPPGRHGHGFVLGLAMDVADGSLIGQHALAYVLAAYVASALSRRILWFPLGQQALHVLPLLLLVQVVQLVVRIMPRRRFPGLELFRRPLRRRRCCGCRSTFAAPAAAIPAGRARRQPADLRNHVHCSCRRFALQLARRRASTLPLRIGDRRLRGAARVRAAVRPLRSTCRSSSTTTTTTLAEDNRISLVPIVPNRGLILDRNGMVHGAQLLGLHPGDHAVQGR